jgi:hypothetical protein
VILSGFGKKKGATRALGEQVKDSLIVYTGP